VNRKSTLSIPEPIAQLHRQLDRMEPGYRIPQRRVRALFLRRHFPVHLIDQPGAGLPTLTGQGTRTNRGPGLAGAGRLDFDLATGHHVGGGRLMCLRRSPGPGDNSPVRAHVVRL